MIAGEGTHAPMTPPLTLSSLPLFPLGSVLFPDGVLALRVFEVRYLDMVRKCHQAGAPFGVVALTHGQEVRQAGAPEERFNDVGTLAVIEQIDSTCIVAVAWRQLEPEATGQLETGAGHRSGLGLANRTGQLVTASGAARNAAAVDGPPGHLIAAR